MQSSIIIFIFLFLFIIIYIVIIDILKMKSVSEFEDIINWLFKITKSKIKIKYEEVKNHALLLIFVAQFLFFLIISCLLVCKILVFL